MRNYLLITVDYDGTKSKTVADDEFIYGDGFPERTPTHDKEITTCFAFSRTTA